MMQTGFPPIGREELTVGILCGGKSRRMGTDKATLLLPSGVTFVEHVAEVAFACSDKVKLLGDCRSLPLSLQNMEQLPDEMPGSGPLVGLQSLLRAANGGWGLLLACDLPRLAYSTVHSLLCRVRSDADAVAYCSPGDAGRLHGCCALYHARILPLVERALARREFRLQDLFATLAKVVVAPTPTEMAQLTNVNTPEEYAALRSG